MNSKGQVSTLINLMFSFVAAIIVYAVTFPLHSDVIDTFLASSSDIVLNTLVRLFPLFMLIGIFIWFFERVGLGAVRR